MKKIGVYILLVVIGGIIGASALYFLMPNQTPTVTEQEVAVTIQGIKYVESNHSVLEIELLNDAPERDLDGTVGIHQGDKEWTSEVTWNYTGYGEAAILVDTINENQSFRITYNEKTPKATYLDRTIEWYEVDVEETVIGFINTKKAKITSMSFVTDGTTDYINITVTNQGTTKVNIDTIKVNDVTILVGNVYFGNGATASLPIELAAGADSVISIDCDWTAGNKYSVNFFETDGTLVGSYTDTA